MSRWTNEQQQAIAEQGKSLLISAAAGSGKTAVLVERIIQKITDPAQPVALDALLVVTFTNAAASEMKERIGAALAEAQKAQPDSQYLYEQMLLLNKAQITTLHSFCLELVRNHFYYLDIAPNLKIADEVESALLKQEALEDVLESYYEDEDKAARLMALADRWGGREDEGVAQLILRLYAQSMSLPDGEAWLQALPEKLQATPWTALYLPIAQEELRQCAQLLHRAVQLTQDAEGLEGYYERFQHEAAVLARLAQTSAEGWDAMVQAVAQGGDCFERLPAVRDAHCDAAVKEQAKAWRDEAKERVKKLRQLLGERTEREILTEMADQAPYVADFAQLTLAFIARYQEKKQAKDLMDFDDMEHFALKLLYTEQDGQQVLSPLAEALRQQYHEVLVDEYQDINDLQERILQAVSREDNLFMVGDIKQSIYGFRMANPQLFLAKYQTYPVEATNGKQKRIDLNRNFRCRENIINAVNDLFRQLMVGERGDLLYDERAALVYGADYPPPKDGRALDETVALLLLERSPAEDEGEAAEEAAAQTLEARQAAAEIGQLIAARTPVFDKALGDYRDLTYRDIVILLRSPRSAALELVQTLEGEGIPCHIDSGDGYFTAWEIQIMLALLHIIDNPLQDIPLAAVLRAPFAAFAESELAQLRLVDRVCPYYHCLEIAASVDDALGAKAKDFLERLTAWRTLARQADISSLLWQLYKDTGFYDYVGALTHGAQRQANLRALHEKARQFEDTSYNGLFMFLRFIQKMQDNDQDLEPAKIISDNENVVRIMSIHKSKGLEFPVVLLLGCAKKFNRQDIAQEIVLDKDLGLGLSAVWPEDNLRYPTICQHLIKSRLTQAMLTEEKRVLYVAFTRAREKLLIIAAVKGAARAVELCGHTPSSSAQCYLDWILPIAKSQSEALAGGSRWQVSVIAPRAGTETAAETAAQDWAAISAGEPLPTLGQYREILHRQLDWRYPDEKITRIPSKVAVSEIKDKQNAAEQQLAEAATPKVYGFTKRPLCVQAKQGLSAAEKGSLIHLFMRHVDLAAEINDAYLQQLAARLETEQFIATGSAAEVDLSAVVRFFQSPLGQRMRANSGRVYRELPFTVAIDSSVLDEALPSDSKPVLLQGIIDCLWEEDDGLVLVDYKSDFVGEAGARRLVETYRGQVALYAQAVEKIWQKPVKERYIYLFAVNACVSV